MALMSAHATKHLESGRLDQAEKFYRYGTKAPLLRQYRLISISNLMVCLHAQERYDEALELWQRDLFPNLERLKPYAGMAAASFTAISVAMGRYQEAVEVSRLPEVQLPEGAIQSLPVHCEIARCSNMVSAQISMGELDEAEKGLEHLSKWLPSHQVLEGFVKMLRARYLFMRGDIPAAVRFAAEADLRSAPPLYRQELELGRALLLTVMGCPEVALLAKQRAPDCVLNNRIRLLHLLLGAEEAYAEEEYEKALSYYEDAFRLPYPTGQFLIRAANLAKRLGRLEDRHRYLSLVAERDPQSNWAKVAQERLAED